MKARGPRAGLAFRHRQDRTKGWNPSPEGRDVRDWISSPHAGSQPDDVVVDTIGVGILANPATLTRQSSNNRPYDPQIKT